MRLLNWDGIRNVRDLGCLATPLAVSGATVPHRVARGPRRESLTPAGWEAARRWGLRTVIDLRNEAERGHRGGDPESGVPRSVSVLDCTLEDHDDPEFVRRCFPILDLPDYWVHHVQLQPERSRAGLEPVAAAEPGVLVHCSAGRDRTGLVCALLLSNAGVSPEDVGADYALSARAMSGEHAGARPEQQGSWALDRLEGTLRRAVATVERFAERSEEVFEYLGVAQATRTALRDLLV